MDVIPTLTAWALGALSFTAIFQNPFSIKHVDIVTGLQHQLSSNASIHLAGTTEFAQKTNRWSKFREPHLAAVVAVTDEHDIQQTILFANTHNIPFLAKTGGHGAIDSLGNVHNGIEIWMRNLNQIQISPDGKTAISGGGVKVKEVVDTLWAAGKQTVTGLCECVGIVGPMLGNGHGVLQGQYGRLADQLLEARMVLANGTAITVSIESHPDLFWALKGAGHNFGIVTELKFRIHDRYDVQSALTWTYESFIFSNDKLEALYTLTNRILERQPPQLNHYSIILRLPSVDSDKPVILYYLLYHGSVEAARQYSALIHELSPLHVEVREAPYPELSALTGNGEDGIACQPGVVTMRFPVGLKEYDVTALRHFYTEFDKFMHAAPAFNNSFFLIEGFSDRAVQEIPADTTSYPHRSFPFLVAPVLYYQPNSSLDIAAEQFGLRARDILLTGKNGAKLEHQAYVNYAHGDESQESMYGYEPWRLERLRRLKQEYDPQGRFNFYAPIL